MLLQFIKYNLVGIVNTFTGFSIIFFLMFIGFTPVVSNLIGYAIGSVVSFYLNSRYTFNNKQKSVSQIIKFFMVLLFSYLLNLLVLQFLLGFINSYIAQLCSAIVYTLSSFVLMKFIVFKEKAE